nr:SpoIIE family protein phosphatase [Ardenticatenales bacterium]
ISRAVGTAPHVEVDLPTEPLRLRPGDVVLLCSDGLTEHIPAEQIEQVVRNRTPEEAAQSLIDAANAAGGSDNISVIILQADESEAEAPAATLVTPTVAAAAEPIPPDKPERTIPMGASLLLLLLLVGGIGGWYLFGNGTLTPAAGIVGSATETPQRTPSPRTTRTPRATPTLTLRAPTVSPDATPPTNTLLSTVLTPSIELLSPGPETITSTAMITFSAIITDIQPGDEVQLRLGSTPEVKDFIFQGASPDEATGTTWTVALNEPPNGAYGVWYWNIVVVSTATGNRLVYLGPARRLEWQP